MSVGSKRGWKARGKNPSHRISNVVARQELGDGNVARCFSKSGERKRGYTTRDQAKKALRLIRKTLGTTPEERASYNAMRPYRCSGCGFFHLGHYKEDGLAIEAQLGEMRRSAVAQGGGLEPDLVIVDERREERNATDHG